jgi:hypothetical protein
MFLASMKTVNSGAILKSDHFRNPNIPLCQKENVYTMTPFRIHYEKFLSALHTQTTPKIAPCASNQPNEPLNSAIAAKNP